MNLAVLARTLNSSRIVQRTLFTSCGNRVINQILRAKIEVEKKFYVPADFEEVLQKEGGTLVSRKHFHDSYFDFCDYSLTLQGCWLRKRDNRWELKHYTQGFKKTPGAIDSYHELETESEILRELLTRVAMVTGTIETMGEFIKKLNCNEFASFTTERSRYLLAGGFHVDLDLASFGYQVGEIEVMVEKEHDIPKMEKKMRELGERLGINWQANFPGKLEEYLRLNNPEHLQKLVEIEKSKHAV